jgi:hypothetical protein
MDEFIVGIEEAAEIAVVSGMSKEQFIEAATKAYDTVQSHKEQAAE